MKEILRSYKQADAQQLPSYCIPIVVNGAVRGRLRPVTREVLHNTDELSKLTEWRRSSSTRFATEFAGSEESTRSWLEHQVLGADDRILFIVEDEDHTPVGQMGLLDYDETEQTCELDNLLRGQKGKFGNIMIYALIAFGEWSVRTLNLRSAYIHVLADNYRAIRIYKSFGAVEIERIPLRKVEEEDGVRWAPSPLPLVEPAEREMLKMTISRENFQQIMKGTSHKK